jgi:peroxiredoxin
MRKLITPLAAVAVLALAFASVSIAADEKKSASGAKPGDIAPAFALQDQDGKTVNLADFKGKLVVLEWFNEECPFVVRHHEADKTMSTLSSKYKGQDVVWLAINSTDGKTNANNKAIAEKWSIGYPILNDADGTVGKAYGAKSTPHMFIIDKDGKLAYKGGIDNDEAGKKAAGEKVNYVEKALDELAAGKPVSTAESKQYGCGVKYAK